MTSPLPAQDELDDDALVERARRGDRQPLGIPLSVAPGWATGAIVSLASISGSSR